MKALNHIIERASKDPRPIVLAEGEDPRIIDAAVVATDRGIAQITLLGDDALIHAQANKAGHTLAGISIINPAHSGLTSRYAQALFQLREKKGMSLEQAQSLARDPLYYANLMVRMGHAEGTVAGAVYATPEVVRTAIQVIGIKQTSKLISSFFIMMLCEPFHALKGGLIFSDCGLVVDPSAEELSEIAMAAASSARDLLMVEPRVAMLSFSTSGSAQHALVDKVVEAAARVKERMPGLAIDGDVQLDAAIVAEIAHRKVSDSAVQGKANVLVFPSLEAGNIGYKLAERIGGAKAIGPLLQGLKKPANDLSRGCSVEDIFHVIAVTVVQAQQN
jgi:phosphate acetyltransferase